MNCSLRTQRSWPVAANVGALLLVLTASACGVLGPADSSQSAIEPETDLPCVAADTEFSTADLDPAEAPPGPTPEQAMEALEGNHAIFQARPALLDGTREIELSESTSRATALYRLVDGSGAILVDLARDNGTWRAISMTSCP